MVERLEAAGLGRTEAESWQAACPDWHSLAGAGRRTRAYWITRYLQMGEDLWRRLPPRPARTEAEESAAEAVKVALREARLAFLRRCGEEVYAGLTGGFARYIRLRELHDLAAERYPGLTPGPDALREEHGRPLKEKEGVEIDQAIFLSQVLGQAKPGAHLVQAMLRPRAESLDLLEPFRQRGELDLGTVRLRREGVTGCLELCNDRYLNAEDDGTVDALEIATDLILLDPAIQVGVLRGGPVSHPRYQGRRVFNAGINLTHLYHGRISYLYYALREMGFVHKVYRGLAGEEFWAHEPEATLEKPWVAVVEAFAIGGGCQLLPVMDHVLAETGAYFNLPARKEGIIPGVSNFRLPRLVGDRLARQAIFFEREFPADSPEGRLLCDAVVPPGQMDAALAQAVATITSAGPVSAVGNRKVLRVGQESLQGFQAYMALYAREQAECHFSPALVRNLERNWQADLRQP